MNNDYYLVAVNKDDEKPVIIPINSKWYSENKIDNFSRGNDISAIDIVTTKFNSEEQIKNQMLQSKYIKSKETDLFIVHKHRYNNKEYINEYDLLFQNKKQDRMATLINISKKAISKKEITISDTDDIINKFLAKIFSKESFYIFMTNPYSKIDKYMIEQIMSNNKLNYGIKYNLKEKLNNYLVIRNIISMWNIYDELISKYTDLDEKELGKQITKDYINNLNEKNKRKKYYDNIKIIIDKNYVEGQVNMDEYLEQKSNPCEEYDDQIKKMYEEADNLKKSPFDDEKLRDLAIKYGDSYLFSNIPKSILNTATLEDKYRLGLMDYVEYKNMKRALNNENGKTHN